MLHASLPHCHLLFHCAIGLLLLRLQPLRGLGRRDVLRILLGAFLKKKTLMQWSRHLQSILATPSADVTEQQLQMLFDAIRSELWPADAEPTRLQSDPMMDIVVFCKGDPTIIKILGDVALHMKDELTWTELAQIIAGVAPL